MWFTWIACSGPATERPDPPPAGCVPVDEVAHDGVDQDCDGVDLVDQDGDGADGPDDCDDLDPAAFPGAAEVPYDGVDQDCDGADLVDQDRDGYDAIEVGGPDCDDLDPDSSPEAHDVADDGVDQNCDGADGVDGDGDGWAGPNSGGMDCDDADPARSPGVDEIWYDGVDQDCDGSCDYDQDGDGAVVPGADILDQSPCDTIPQPFLVGANEDCDDLDPGASIHAASSRSPDVGALDVPVADPIVVDLTLADPAATLTLADAAGPVPGTFTVDGDSLTLVPDAPLAAATTYSLTLTHACGVEAWDFTTEVPRDPVDPVALVGAVYEIELASGSWTPYGALVDAYFTHTWWVAVDAADESGVDLTFAPAVAGAQDLCLPVSTAAVAFAPNPELAATGLTLELPLAGVTATLHAAELTGAVAGSGALLGDLRIAGLLQTAPLVEAVVPGAPADTLCALISACEPCPDGTATCVSVILEDLEGAPVDVWVDPAPVCP